MAEAEQDNQFHSTHSVGDKTRPLTTNRDIVGSLAHQAVEYCFEQTRFLYNSTRKVRRLHGDDFDIQYEDDFIDVKGTCKDFNEKWFFNNNFLVLEQQVASIATKKITHFCFVEIDKEFKIARVFGVINVPEFCRISERVQLKYNNYSIKARQLTPFKSYAYRTWER